MEKEISQKKEKNAVQKIFGIALKCVAIIFGAAFALLLFCALHRSKPLSFLPENYTAVIHTDSLFEAAAPVLELKAADALLSEGNLSQFRASFMQARDFFNQSNFFVKKILSRRADIALYPGSEGGFVAAVDLSFLSAATRMGSVLANFLKIENLSYAQGHFEYALPNGKIFVKPQRNLAIVSTSKTLFEKSISENRIPSKEEKDLIEGEKTKSLKIVANAKKIAELILEESDIKSQVSPLIKEDALTCVQFSLSNAEIDLQIVLPLFLEKSDSALAEIFKAPSTPPKLVSVLTNKTQYYTSLNLPSLSHAKNAAFEVMKNSSEISEAWRKADNLCKTLFSLSVDDVIFSWTGGECAVLGIEGSSEPVFALQVSDENQRRKIFEKLDKSFALNSNTNLIVGGMRLPCFELHPILSALLKIFGVSLPRPYYLVQNGFVYFSLSPQNLSSIHKHAKENFVIAKNENWKSASKNSKANSSVGIYYNLKRSLPFFIANDSTFAKILRLYEIGRCDVSFDGKSLAVHLLALSSDESEGEKIPGFPVATGKPSDFVLHFAEGGDCVFWLEEGGAVKSLDLSSLKVSEKKFGEECFVAAQIAGEEGALWAATKSGNIYLLEKDLREKENFPIVTGERISCGGSVVKTKRGVLFAVPAESGKILFAQNKKNEPSVFEVEIEGANFKSAPFVCEEKFALYDRGFEGKIHLFSDAASPSKTFEIDGIGFGSPCVAAQKGKTLVAFVTQAGDFHLFDAKAGSEEKGFPLKIDDVFFSNAVFYEGAFFALSEKAVLYKITQDAETLAVRLPQTESAKEGTLFATTQKNASGVYASGDANILFAFDSKLELLLSFPLEGRGTPALCDANKDKKIDCLALSMSRELNGWNLESEK